MAEFGLAVTQALFAALQLPELREICSIWGYKSQLEKLEKTVNTIKDVLKDADSKSELSYEQLGYVKALKDVVYEADDVFDEFVTLLELKQLSGSLSKHHRFIEKVRSFFSSTESKFSEAYRMYHKVKEIKTKLNAIVDNHKKFALGVDYKRICLRREETCSYVDFKDIIGRDDDRKAIIEKLLESKGHQNVCFLSIFGEGGLGKTALAQLVYNDKDIQLEFGDLRFWVCVSDQENQQFDVKVILSKILGQTTNFEGYTMQSVQQKIQEKLGGKKYMLVLDDVWNEDREKWVDLQRFLKIGKGGSRILVTTRSEMTAKITSDSEHTYKLQSLSPKNSWDLFKMVAFHQENYHQKEFLEIGENIAVKCYNNPLAIKVVGSLLYGQDISQWRLFEENDLADIHKGNNKIMTVLKFSYHNLETSLKSCFTYCAVFPKGSRILKKMWINLWIAQGYIVPTHKGQSIKDAAEEAFLILLRRCFFQDIEKNKYGDVKSVKIHDLMHELAKEVAGEEIQILYSSANNYFKDEVCHLSFVAGRNNFPPSSSTKTNRLRSYIHIYSPEPNWGEHLALNKFKYLRVLDVKYLTDAESYESIGELLHLRYLNLSHSNFTALPSSITKLHNLQTLILRHSHQLRELPNDLNKLVNLRHLDLSKLSNLACIPSGVDKLTNLKVLTDFVVGKRDHPIGNECVEEFKDLETLTNLRGRITVCICHNYRNVKRAMSGSYLGQMRHIKKVVIIFWGECVDPESVIEMLEPPPNLKVLRLELYHGQTIPWWRKTTTNEAIISLLNLVRIKITECNELQTMPSFSEMPYLKSLELEFLNKLEYMEEASSSSSHAEAKETPFFFPSLESLLIKSAPKLKGWFGGAHSCSSKGFPRLFQLKIECCDKLESFPPCPSVKHLHCEKSGILKQVVVNRSYTTLDTLIIKRNKELKSLSELSTVFMSCASSLRSLTIDCPHLQSMSISEGLEHLTALETLSISGNYILCYSEDDVMASWKSLHQKLHTLELPRLDDNTSLPKGMQHLTALRRLRISYCPNLDFLPEWISCLSSLQYLEISECSRILKQRCNEPNGPDWPKIQHIPNVTIGNLYF